MLENFEVGIDIVKINRFKSLPYEENKRFYHKIFNDLEIDYCISFKDPYPHFAGRFAIKEAVIKSTNKKLNLKDIEIFQEESRIKIKIKEKLFLSRISLSHDGDYAIAITILEKNQTK